MGEMSNPESPFPNAATPEIREFLVAARAYCAAAKPPLSPASLSSLLFDAGAQIARLETGADITTGRLRAAWARLKALEAGGPRTRKPRIPTTTGAHDGEARDV